MLNRSSSSDANEETDDLRDTWLSRLTWVREVLVLEEWTCMPASFGVRGRWVEVDRYAEAGAKGGPINPGDAGRCSKDFFSAAMIASRWSTGNGGWPRLCTLDDKLVELPGR